MFAPQKFGSSITVVRSDLKSSRRFSSREDGGSVNYCILITGNILRGRPLKVEETLRAAEQTPNVGTF